MFKWVTYFVLLLSLGAVAEENDALTIDRAINSELQLSFPNDKGVKPSASDFLMENYLLMSNELGERWAVVTLTNGSSGNRVLKAEHIMALFADGERKVSDEFKLNFAGHETQSFTLSFGVSKFPILALYTQVN